MGLVVDLATE